MKKLVAILILFQVLSNSLDARCINTKHRKAKNKVATDKKIEAYDYGCQVRAVETESFDSNGSCKNCGCPISDHDNVQG